ncbi:TfoX/Sxy family protein [Schumannella soli]|uniref:TfoX/Sxy family protein n=1 Tax=Schumannella soli TaxID=2590779 RepID=A0A506XTA0_9MICO|nr:TfoX/Sxy family protein [Schumannella soli]TPW76034.1 TfoX/Sxy family protein [Schumannella soli]
MVAINPDHDRLARLAAGLLEHEDVDWGRMFGSIGLRVRGKVFAVALYQGGMMAKLPESTVDELEAAGTGERMSMAGRPRREWIRLASSADDRRWSEVIVAAHHYVDSITPRSESR